MALNLLIQVSVVGFVANLRKIERLKNKTIMGCCNALAPEYPVAVRAPCAELCTQVPNVMADDTSWRVTTQAAMMKGM